MKCADIPDAAFLEVVARINQQDGWAFVWDVARILGIPGKLAEAKAYILIRRKLMDGCDARHWCRGDYTVLHAGHELIAAASEADRRWRNPAPVSKSESGDNPYV